MMRKTLLMMTSLCAVAVGVEEESRWSFSLGPTRRSGVELQLRGSSHSQQLGLQVGQAAYHSSHRQSSSALGDNPGIFADRRFDDGFVFIDPGTVEFGGDTWFWGYEHAAQVREGHLLFHRGYEHTEIRSGRETRVTTLRDQAWERDAQLEGEGLEAVLGYLLHRSERWQMQWRMGLAGLWNLQQRFAGSTYAQRADTESWSLTRKEQVQQVYSYDLMGVVPPPPPYEGSYEGWPPPSPLLPNRPESVGREVQAVEQTSTRSVRKREGWNELALKVDAEAWVLWTGPQFMWSPHRRIGLFVQPAATLSLLQVRSDRWEQWWIDEGQGPVAAQRWHDAVDIDHWRPGLSVYGGVQVDLSEHWFLTFKGGYEWVPDRVFVDLGPNRIALDLSGAQMTGGLGCRW